eukprot:CAMPEP_0174712970 /NCGR_PEP_ID=MMETSP1094-20130205/13790_1 /TAXON_ID=156173 /ORGANISM="Chrysochromulina brevifilum, Strain UTEX LB 985" /LENGTH=51 /DNA_ID=CAMNT_0015912097 /DNA_START=233 /DNA_END=388 /DNA_ORIENTATION=-
MSTITFVAVRDLMKHAAQGKEEREHKRRAREAEAGKRDAEHNPERVLNKVV